MKYFYLIFFHCFWSHVNEWLFISCICKEWLLSVTVIRYSTSGEKGIGPAIYIFFSLKDISESIRLRKFKPSRFEWHLFKLYFHMYFDPQRSFVACTGLVISKTSVKFLALKSEASLYLLRLQGYISIKLERLYISRSLIEFPLW